MKKPLIFLCDDDRDIVEVVMLILGADYNVQVYHRCEGIADDAERCNPSVILLDLRMPMSGGGSVLRQLKASPLTRHIPVILFSATNNLQRIAAESGADAFLEKPFDIGHLCDLVNSFANRRKEAEGTPISARCAQDPQ